MKESGEGEAGQNALFQACQPADNLPFPLAADKKMKSYKDIFEFRVSSGAGNVKKEVSRVISMKPGRKKTKQANI